MYHRYGELSLRDLWPLVCENIVSVFLAVLFFAMKSGWSVIAGVGMLGCAAISLYSISSAMSERFTVCNNSISVSKFGRISAISLPEEIMVVISTADIRTPFAVYTALGKETRILHGRYAVTLYCKKCRPRCCLNACIIITFRNIQHLPSRIYCLSISTFTALLAMRHCSRRYSKPQIAVLSFRLL